MQPSNRPTNDTARWLPAVAAAGVLGAVVFAGAAMGGSGDESPQPAGLAAPVTTPPGVVVSTLPVPSSTPDVIAPVEGAESAEKFALTRTLSEGMAGDDVLAVQTRLDELGFWLGEPDGYYGPMTRRAVWAYEKLVLGAPSESPSGKVTPEMWDGLQESFVVQPRRPNATPDHTEVYLPEQVLAVFHNDIPQIILHMSSGDGEEWCEEVVISPGEWGNEDGEEPLIQGQCGVSSTPGGVFRVHREVEGRRESALGGMLNPVYFNYGIAIHGAHNVPLYPASHGCIRIVNDVSDEVQAMIDHGDQVFVWDGVKEPEEYGEQLPRFNWIDPEWRATSTTSTTVPETTTTTTEPPTATTQPPTATTTTTTLAPDPGGSGGAGTGGGDDDAATTGGVSTGGTTGGSAGDGDGAGATAGGDATTGSASGASTGGDTGESSEDLDGASEAETHAGDAERTEADAPAAGTGTDASASSD